MRFALHYKQFCEKGSAVFERISPVYIKVQDKVTKIGNFDQFVAYNKYFTAGLANSARIY